MPPLSVSFWRHFELHHGFCTSRVKYCATLDPNWYRQWARPSLRVFILKELNTAECEGLASETRCQDWHSFYHLDTTSYTKKGPRGRGALFLEMYLIQRMI